MRSKIVWRSSAALAATLAGVIAVSGLQAASTPLADAAAHQVDSQNLRLVSIRKSVDYGGNGGNEFDDTRSGLPDNARVRTIYIRTGDRVDQVGVTLTNGTTRQHGGMGGNQHSLILSSDEYITSVELTVSPVDAARGRRVTYIEIRTNRARILSGGRRSADSIFLRAPNGTQVAGFYGRSGGNVDRLGLLYTSR